MSTVVEVDMLLEAAKQVEMTRELDKCGDAFNAALDNLRRVARTFTDPSMFATQEQVDRANELHGSNEVEIDQGAFLSPADGGFWVSAWVWVPGGTGEENDDE